MYMYMHIYAICVVIGHCAAIYITFFYCIVIVLCCVYIGTYVCAHYYSKISQSVSDYFSVTTCIFIVVHIQYEENTFTGYYDTLYNMHFLYTPLLSFLCTFVS
jgi:hypothetical protein